MRYLIALLLLLAIFSGAGGDAAWAGPLPPPDVSDEPRPELPADCSAYIGNIGDINLNEISIVCCPNDGFFTGRVVYCVEQAIRDVTERFLYQISRIMWPINYVLFAVALGIFGIKIMFGDTEVQQKAIAIFFKIGIIAMFGNNLNGWAPLIFDMLESAASLVTGTLDFAGGYSCDLGEIAAAYVTPGNSVMWQRMDCIIDNLFGTGENNMLYQSMFAFLPVMLFAGSLGIPIFMLGIAALLGVMSYVFRAVYAYLLAFLYLGVLIMISPMVLPLLLVNHELGVRAISGWCNQMLATIATPMMIFAYLAVSMPILDAAITGGAGQISNSIEEVLGPTEEREKFFRQNQQFCSRTSPLNPDQYKNQKSDIWKDDGEVQAALDPQAPLGNFLAPLLTANWDQCEFFQASTVDFGEKHTEKLIDILFASVKLLVIVVLVSMGMNAAPQLVTAIFQAQTGLGGQFARSDITGKIADSGAGKKAATASAGSRSAVSKQLFNLRG